MPAAGRTQEKTMTTSIDRNVHIYDEFAGPNVDEARWNFFQFPLPDGSAYVCSEADAITEVRDGALRVTVEKFANSHVVQPMDNVKHFLLSTSEFPLDAGGVTEISGEIAARSINARPRDYRDGFVSLVSIDMATGYVFDLCATSDSVFAIYEQLPFPGVEHPFTYVAEEPLSGLEVSPDRVYRCRIAFDGPARSVRYYVNDVKVFEAVVPSLPQSVRIGLGMFSLHPTTATQSRSLHGQGLSGLWRNIGATATGRTGE
jgi:hypothetical protein